MNPNFIIGQNIKFEREKKKMKLETLARELDLTKGAMSHIESGRVNLRISRIQKIAEVLGISINILLTTGDFDATIDDSRNAKVIFTNNHFRLPDLQVSFTILSKQLLQNDEQLIQQLYKITTLLESKSSC